ncbi:DNA repair protein RecN [Hespellia stercorisuis]|uniref:DNA repair protein RecN n=1 Tax=Hespellia stercorisuis DSM 15480 TaxID=1121950 RepID=A0A1M6HMJ6_9FIRM|nr:DNA repair protein RecN [Hespellia stercorisuis]SHJ23412.1 DNA replication and repair protein RecN [Hespellia stercorisuis DSM 15480]
MLRNLHVKNLALIDEVEVNFQPGLNILTGETGAGKSIILGSVHLALGGRYTRDMLRKGSDFGLVELVFEPENPAIIRQLKEMDIFLEEGQILLSRKLMDGRSVSKINGETVNMSVLRDVASILIDIHGQHDHESLLHKKNHLAILDAYARDSVDSLKKKLAEEYRHYRACRRELEDASMDEAERKREVALLAFEVDEITDAGLRPGEDQELEEQYRRMTGGKKLSEAIAETYRYTGEAEGVSDALSRAIRTMQEISGTEEKAEELYGQLVDVDSLLNDFNRELMEYAKTFEFSEEEFHEVEERLNLVNHLKSKYGNDVEEISAYCEKQEKRLSELQDYDAYLAGLSSALESAEQKLSTDSDKLSRARKKAAVSLTQEIKQALIELNFLEVQFDMQFEQMKDYTENGRDDAQFIVSTNPGEEMKALYNVASGGELSRIMLAVKTVLADREDTPTLIFDEIDTGISGITAGKVAGQMRIIGRNHQVICITHLPQIAAMADAHFAIEKKAENGKTTTGIRLLNQSESEGELARILGGAEITDTILQSAKEMKEMAKREKNASVK